MTSSPSQSPRRSIRPYIFVGVAFILGAVVMARIAALLVNIENRKMEAALSPAQIALIPEDTIDPAVWGRNKERGHQAMAFTPPRGATKQRGRMGRAVVMSMMPPVRFELTRPKA